MTLPREMYIGHNINRDKVLSDAQRLAREGQVVIVHNHAKASGECGFGCYQYEGDKCSPYQEAL